MPQLDLSALIPLLERGQPFELTEKQYEEKIKKELPKKRNSPIARKAKEYGYKIQVEERIHRVLIFTKKDG